MNRNANITIGEDSSSVIGLVSFTPIISGTAVFTTSGYGTLEFISSGSVAIPTFDLIITKTWQAENRDWTSIVELPGGIVGNTYQWAETYVRHFYVQASIEYTFTFTIRTRPGITVTINPSETYDHYATLTGILP
jgi:hypothetical protein